MSNIEMEALDFKYLLLEYYKNLKLDEKELAVLLLVDHLLEQKNSLITSDLLALKMNLSSSEIDKILAGLYERKLISYEAKNNFKTSLKPLKKKLYDYFEKSLAKNAELQFSKDKEESLHNIYEFFESQFNRSLSPIEISRIGDWIDSGYDEDTIRTAVKEAIRSNKRTIKAVDEILLKYTARDDIEHNGYTAISDTWDKSMEETIRIAKTKWLDDEEN